LNILLKNLINFCEKLTVDITGFGYYNNLKGLFDG